MTKMTTTLTKGGAALAPAKFLEAVQAEYVKKYAQDVVAMYEDKRKLEKALKRIDGWLGRVEKGEYEAIEQYKKSRTKLEQEDEYEL